MEVCMMLGSWEGSTRAGTSRREREPREEVDRHGVGRKAMNGRTGLTGYADTQRPLSLYCSGGEDVQQAFECKE